MDNTSLGPYTWLHHDGRFQLSTVSAETEATNTNLTITPTTMVNPSTSSPITKRMISKDYKIWLILAPRNFHSFTHLLPRMFVLSPPTSAWSKAKEESREGSCGQKRESHWERKRENGNGSEDASTQRLRKLSIILLILPYDIIQTTYLFIYNISHQH